ncbi:hypothetical protein A1D29_01325 [Pasteurellaceae bacterium Orientalotternb1]|nr:hypothetical protein A1D29_01325 [Pasteurellaceae bacterium Orientalotternb1]
MSYKRVLLSFFLLLLAGCSSSLQVVQLPPQPTESRLFAVEQLQPQQEKSLLAVQFSPNNWRWVQTDPLGAPLARVQLTQSGWQNDGFVMPNAQAIQLFAALATALNPSQPPFAFSRIENGLQGKIYFDSNRKLWEISQQSQQINIRLGDQSQWRLTELEP